MRIIDVFYAAFGIASTQDVRDLQVSVASAHQRLKTLEQSVTDAKFEFKNLRASVAEAHGGTPSLRQRIAAVEVRSRRLDDIPALHEAIARTEETTTLVRRLDDRSNLFHDALARVDEVTESLQGKVDGLLDVDAVDVDQLCDQVESNLDIDDIADRVKDTIDKPLGSDKIDHAVNQAIEREAPGIIGSVLKHIDWSEELTVDATVHSNR